MATSVLLARSVRSAPLVQFVLNAWGCAPFNNGLLQVLGVDGGEIVFKRD